MVIRLLKSIFPKWYRKQMLISSSIHPFIEGKRRHTKINNARQLHPSISIPLFHFPTSGSLIGSSYSPNNIYSHFFFPAGIQFLYFFGRLLVFNFTSLSTGNRKNGKGKLKWGPPRHLPRVRDDVDVAATMWDGVSWRQAQRDEFGLGPAPVRAALLARDTWLRLWAYVAWACEMTKVAF